MRTPADRVIFYKNDTVVNRISICLGCNNSVTDIYIPARNHKSLNKGTDSEYGFTGYTKFGKAAIIKLCKELKLKYGTFEIK